MLSREKALSRSGKIISEHVTMPEWDGDVVTVRQMDGLEFEAFEAEHVALRQSGSATQHMRARTVVATAYGPDGTRLFNDEDVEAVAKFPCLELSRLFNVAARLNGFDQGKAAKND